MRSPSPPLSESSIKTEDTTFNKTKGPGRLAHHDYHDHSHDLESSFINNVPAPRSGVAIVFPIQLHEMLESIEQHGYGHVISWQPHGRCFVIHKKQEFINHIMPAFMKQSKFPSFRRQLNLYGFQRITAGPDRGGYYHELFLRGKPFLARRMQRQCIKGTGVRCRNNPAEEPNFYKMAPVTAVSSISDSEGDSSMESSDCESSASTPDLVVSSNTSPSDDDDDLAFFSGKNFHMLEGDDESWLEMDCFLESVSEEEEQKASLVEDGNDINYEALLEELICQ